MPITDKQRLQRRSHVGSSDTAAILGVNPYMSAEDVRLSKLHDIDIKSTMAMSIGHHLEKGILDWAEGDGGLGKITRNQRRVAKEGAVIASNLDGLTAIPEPVEAKMSGITGPVIGYWGDEGTDEVPETVMVQCQHHLAVTGALQCHVPALLGGRGLCMFVVQRSETLVGWILEETGRFWRDHVEADVPCPDVVASVEVLKALRREPDSVIELGNEAAAILEQYDTAAAEKKITTDYHDKYLKPRLIQLLGDNEAGLLPDGRMITYKATERKGFTVEPTTVRTLRVTKARRQLT